MKIRIPKTIRCQCPHCGVVLETKDPVAGMQVKCPKCGGEFVATPLKVAPRAFTAGKSANPAKPQRKKRHWVKNMLVILCLLAYIVVRYAGWVEKQQRKAEVQKQREEEAALTGLAVGAGVVGTVALLLWGAAAANPDPQITINVR